MEPNPLLDVRCLDCPIPAVLDGLFADTLTQEQVSVVEILEEGGEERIAAAATYRVGYFKNANTVG